MRARAHRALPVRQERSKQTRDRLLDAVELVWGRDGVDGATIPAIAAEAEVSVGSVYRRFPDKDALLRGAYERFFEEAAVNNAAHLAPSQWSGRGAAEILATTIDGMVRGHRLKRPLLRALVQYGETHADAAFRRRALALRSATIAQLTDLLLSRADELRTTEPRVALDFTMTVLRFTLQGFLLDEARDQDDGALARRLTQMVCAYLGLRHSSLDDTCDVGRVVRN